MTGGLHREIALLLAFLDRAPLTLAIRDLEQALDGCDGEAAAEAVAAVGIDNELLSAALAMRQQLGRLNDLIHASAITLLLPAVLEADEIIQGCPSLAAGNDPMRPYDLQTSKRVAEFKLAIGPGQMRCENAVSSKTSSTLPLTNLAAGLSCLSLGRRRSSFSENPPRRRLGDSIAPPAHEPSLRSASVR